MDTGLLHMKRRRRKRKKQRLSKEDIQRKRESTRFKKSINTIFTNSGFKQIPTRDKNFQFQSRTIEIDNIFVFENVLIIVEDTEAKTENIKDHLLKTLDTFRLISKHKDDFISVISSTFERFNEVQNDRYHNSDYVIKCLYCSYNNIDKRYIDRYCHEVIFLDYHSLQYFYNLSRILKKTTRYELFKFLNLSLVDVGTSRAGQDCTVYDGFLLPESPSGFPRGYKIVSFLIEPNALLEQSYVLRKQGWRDDNCLYQRLLKHNKILKMREYLVHEKRVFVNNIIVSLPRETTLCDANNKPIYCADISKRTCVKIQIPRGIETFGIIDGQHRIYAYHESNDKYEEAIKSLREKQHLLVTGIMHPESISVPDRSRFEAQLFLEINDKQTKAKSDLKQSISMLIEPYSNIAISKRILINLSKTGPLNGLLEIYFYETKKIKTASIVSFGLSHLIKFKNDDSLFKQWDHSEKEILLKGTRRDVLDAYVEFCTAKINDFLVAFKKTIPNEMWTLDTKKSRVLTTTTINGLINCLRLLAKNNKIRSMSYYEQRLKNHKIKFAPKDFKYTSSHWKELGEELYNSCFK